VPSGTRDSVARLLQAVLPAMVMICLGGIQPARAGALELSALQLGACPLFPGVGDPAWCRSALQPADLPPGPPLPLPPLATFLPDDDYALLDVDAFAAALPADSLSTSMSLPVSLPPFGRPVPAGPGLGLTVSHSPDSGDDLLRAAYDVPVADGFRVSSHSALHQAADAGNSLDSLTNDASSGLSVVYATDRITFVVEPDVAVNWSDAVAGQTRLGVANRMATRLARDLSLSLSAGYDSFLYADDPLQNYRALQQRIAMTWGRDGGWQFGLSATSRSEWSLYEARRLISPGMAVTMPLTGDLSLTTRNDFGFTRRDPFDAGAQAREDYRNSFGLEAAWSPALLASHAVRVMAGYTLSYDTSLAAGAGLANNVDLYETLARLAVAMRF